MMFVTYDPFTMDTNTIVFNDGQKASLPNDLWMAANTIVTFSQQRDECDVKVIALQPYVDKLSSFVSQIEKETYGKQSIRVQGV